MKIFAIPMTPITAYSISHIAIVICIILISVALAYTLNKSKIQAKTVVFACTILLIVMEVFKQLLLTYVRGGAYSWSDFPFQLCSTPMYLCIVYLCRPKLRNYISDFIMVFGFIGAIASFIVPYSSLYSYLFLTTQSFLWHGILLFLSIYLCLIRNNDYTPDYKPVSIIYIILSVIALFFNIIFYKVSGGTSNMFFFGPGYPEMFILNTIYEKTNWIVETLIMAIVSLLSGWMVYNAQVRFRTFFAIHISKKL